MIDLDRRYGIWSGRVWGLILNLLANTLALYGLVGFIRDGTHLCRTEVMLGYSYVIEASSLAE